VDVGPIESRPAAGDTPVEQPLAAGVDEAADARRSNIGAEWAPALLPVSQDANEQPDREAEGRDQHRERLPAPVLFPPLGPTPGRCPLDESGPRSCLPQEPPGLPRVLAAHGETVADARWQADPGSVERAIEQALSVALAKAANAERWDLVAQLARELEGRRLARDVRS
jgi:hypothetical protein